MGWIKDFITGKPHHPPAQIVDTHFEWSFVRLSPAPGWGNWTIEFWQTPWREKEGRTDGITISFQGNREEAMARCRQIDQDLLNKWLDMKEEERREKQQEHDELAKMRDGSHVPGPRAECPACKEAEG